MAIGYTQGSSHLKIDRLQPTKPKRFVTQGRLSSGRRRFLKPLTRDFGDGRDDWIRTALGVGKNIGCRRYHDHQLIDDKRKDEQYKDKTHCFQKIFHVVFTSEK